MIHLNLAVQDEMAVYLDVQGIEARHESAGEGFALTGTLGDGLYEGEVLLEIGEKVEVTFIDEWLGCAELNRFFRRVEREALDSALAEAVAEMRFCIDSFPALEGKPERRVTGYHVEGRWYALRPRGYAEQLELPLAVARGEPDGEDKRHEQLMTDDR